MDPLSDLIALDLSRVLSGPFGTQQLIDLGATVIKIEHPKTGDDTRAFGPPFIKGESAYFMSINRAKKSVAIDLKSDEGKDLIRSLARSADVLIENFRPGTLARLGFNLAAMRAENPGLVTCSISGYGSYGDPDYAQRGGYDAVIQAVSGLMSLTGPADGAPSKVGVAIADRIAGLYAAQGILAALVARSKTGKGRHVEVSMQDAMCAILTYQAAIYFATDRSPARMGDAHLTICPYESVPVKDGMFMLAVGNDAQFRKFADLIGRPELADDPRYSTNSKRVEHRPELLDTLSDELQKRTAKEWEEALGNAQIPGGPILEIADALTHPQLLARGTILHHEHPTAGSIRTVRSPIRSGEKDAADVEIDPPPLLGQHTKEVLMERLGLSENDVADLHARGIVYAA